MMHWGDGVMETRPRERESSWVQLPASRLHESRRRAAWRLEVVA